MASLNFSPRLRRLPVLDGSQWRPEADDLAASFGVAALPGIFNKSLRLPPGMRAWILQRGEATEVGPGEYELEGLFERLNHLLRDQGGAVLVARSTPLPLRFEIDALRSSEGLAITATLQISVKVEQVGLFARHFMAEDGVIGAPQLLALLEPLVRQSALEYCASQSLRDMARNANLRPQWEERLHSALAQRLARLGLAIHAVDACELRHDAGPESRVYLAVEKAGQQLAYARQLDQIYNEDAWRRLEKEEQAQRARLRQTELALEHGERVQGLRLRSIDLYDRVAQARNRQQALARGAADTVAELEHQLAEKAAGRLNEQEQWEHVRTLARVRQRTELELARRSGMADIERAQQTMRQRLEAQQLEFRIEQAARVTDASQQRALQATLHEAKLAAARHEATLAAEQQRAALALAAFANAAREQEASHLREWERTMADSRQQAHAREEALKALEAREREQLVAQRIADQEREGRVRDAHSQHAKLLRTLEAEQQFNANQRLQERARWQDAQESRQAEFTQAQTLARIEIERIEALGKIEAARLEAMGKLGVAPLVKDSGVQD